MSRYLLLAVLVCAAISSGHDARADESLEGNVNAPEFPRHLQWVNSPPVSLSALRGKLVLLDFWTLGCINCMHIIPDLEKLEEKYPQELVVLGIHSGKFETERQAAQIEKAIRRYGIEHAVLNDNGFEVWKSYAVRAWPTVVLINPRGKIIAERAGEGVFQAFDPLIARAVSYFDRQKELKRAPLELAAKKTVNTAQLSFPGKIAADPAGNRLAVADSSNHRVLVVSPGGEVLEIIGSGSEGLEDGPFAAARFRRPQGLAFDGDTLLIADTQNHVIRRADLREKKVTTVLGSGSQGSKAAGAGREADLNSPWDILLNGNTLYIAMAGAHQIWSADILNWEISPVAGSGAEALLDGRAEEAALAQPSGLALTGSRLYFADSESSAIRFFDLEKRTVQTLVGKGLFEFGDQDGPLSEALLQHPLAAAVREQRLFVADTYNSKIKVIDLAQRTVTTLAGGDRSGNSVRFDHPGGLALVNGKLFVADTNNNAIRVVDTNSGVVAPFEIKMSRETAEAHSALK